MTSPAEAYDSFLVPAIFEPCSRDLIQRAKVFRGDRVLDVATGTGIVACRIAATGAKVTGLDPAPAMLEQARKRAAAEGVGVTWVERSAESLPFAAKAFDLVICQHGLQHVGDRAAAVKEMRRVVAPGGRAVIACWAGVDTHPVHELLDEIGFFGAGDGGTSSPFSLGDEAALRQLLTGARFHAVAVERVTRTVRVPEPERFPALAGFVEGDQLVFPLTSHIAIGRVPTEG